MRKDVRMGFAVGGVLLAVIIVAVLVVHRNHTNKGVVFNPGTGQPASPGDQGGVDVTPPSDNPKPGDQGQSPAQNAVPKSDSSTLARTADPKDAPARQNPESAAGDRWDALFASNAADPIKQELSSPGGRAKPERSSDLTRERTADAGSEPQPDIAVRTEQRPSSGDSSSLVANPATPARIERASASGTTHVIQPGETFVSIARMVYGDGRFYKALVDANPSINPSRLKPGDTIKVPPSSEVKQSARRSANASATPGAASSTDGKTYTVRKDDSLYAIAKKLYHRGDKADELYELNKQVIGSDRTKLKPGMVLKLPAKPLASAQ